MINKEAAVETFSNSGRTLLLPAIGETVEI
jgi:hypothetical protein